MNTTWIKACLVHGSAHTQLLLCDWAYLCVQLNTWCVTMKRCLRTTTCTHMHIHATSKTRSHRAPVAPAGDEMQRELRSPMAAWSGKIVRRSGPESIALTSSRPRGVGESNTVATALRGHPPAPPPGGSGTRQPPHARAQHTQHMRWRLAPSEIGIAPGRPSTPPGHAATSLRVRQMPTRLEYTQYAPPPRTRPRKVERLSPGTC